MKRDLIICMILCVMGIIGFISPAFAIPTFQVYIEGATAGSYGSDQDTWFSFDNPLTLYVVGAYGSNTISITGVTLLISVPEGETGTISISGDLDDPTDIPVLLTKIGEGSADETNPTADANIVILTDISGASGYSTINDPTFLPNGLNLNNHYPLKDDVSDFLIFDLWSFTSDECGLMDYNADNGGSITSTLACGEQKEYQVSYTGFSWLHFDVYGLVEDNKGKKIVTTWDNNPGSHDATAVIPEPTTLFFLGTGLLTFGLIRCRKRRKSKRR
jgi:hypothetical protein